MSLVAILQAKGERGSVAPCERGSPHPSATLLLVALLAGFGHFDGN
jgi:hypothetical protein